MVITLNLEDKINNVEVVFELLQIFANPSVQQKVLSNFERSQVCTYV